MNDERRENLPSGLVSLCGTMAAGFAGAILLTGFCLLAPELTRTRGASSSQRLIHVREKIEAGEPLTEGERLLLEESEDSDAAPGRP